MFHRQWTQSNVPPPTSDQLSSLPSPPMPQSDSGWREVWEDGQAYDELNHRLKAIAQQKEAITLAQKVCLPTSRNPLRYAHPIAASQPAETCLLCVAAFHSQSNCAQAVRKQLPPPHHPLHTGQPGVASASATEAFIQPAEYVARDEVFKVRLSLFYSSLHVGMTHWRSSVRLPGERLYIRKPARWHITLGGRDVPRFGLRR